MSNFDFSKFRRFSAYGVGVRGDRVYNFPVYIKPPNFSEVISAYPVIDLFSATGVLFGQIRSDGEKTILNSAEFTISKNGSESATIVLTRQPEFLLLNSSTMKIIFRETNETGAAIVAFGGRISRINDKLGEITLSVDGWASYLDDLTHSEIYSQNDIANIVDAIFQWIATETPLKYSSIYIDYDSGFATGGDIEFNLASVRTILDSLTDMCSTEDSAGQNYYYNWGVNGDGFLFFKKSEKRTSKKTFFIGGDVNDFEYVDPQDSYNTITVLRSQSAGSDSAGWGVAAVASDDQAIKRQGGVRRYEYQIPAYLEDADAEVIAQALLREYSDLNRGIKLKNIPLRSGQDVLELGTYRIIWPWEHNWEIANSLETSNDIEIIETTATGDAVKSTDMDFFVEGNSGAKVAWQDSYSARVVLFDDADEDILSVEFYARSLRDNLSLNMYITNFFDDIIETKLNCVQASVFYPVRFETNGLKKIEIELNDALIGQSLIFNRLSVKKYNCKTEYMSYQSATYRISPDNISFDFTIGPKKPSVLTFIEGQKKILELTKAAAEVR